MNSSILFGEKVIDESVRLLSGEIYELLEDPKNEKIIEIEAKIGKLLHRSSDNRCSLPVSTETILKPGYDQYNFSSTLDMDVFRQLNLFLNEQYTKSQKIQGGKITYKRTKECDLFYHSKEKQKRVRVSVDPETRKQLRSIIKEKKKNFDFYCPYSSFDFRITLSLENVVPFPKDEEIPFLERYKDRLSYEFDVWKIDITTVTESKLDHFGQHIQNNTSVTYEVEMECKIDNFVMEKQKILKGEKNKFSDLSAEIISNVKNLLKVCEPKQQVFQKQQIVQKIPIPTIDKKRKLE